VFSFDERIEKGKDKDVGDKDFEKEAKDKDTRKDKEAVKDKDIKRDKEPLKEKDILKEKDKEKDPKKRVNSFDERIEKGAQFHRLFELPVSENLVDDYSCAYYKSFLRQGRLYVSEGHIAFYSMVGVKLTLSYGTIHSIEKRKTLDTFNNAIIVTTTDAQDHFFTSFLIRDQAHAVMSEVWTLHQRAATAAATAALQAARPLSLDTAADDDAEGSDGARSMRTRSSYSSSEENSEEPVAPAWPPTPRERTRRRRAPPSPAAPPPLRRPHVQGLRVASLDEAMAMECLADPNFGPPTELLKKPMKTALPFPQGGRLEDVFEALLADSAAFFAAYHARQGDRVVDLRPWQWRTLSEDSGSCPWGGTRQAEFSTEVAMPKRTWVSAYERHAFAYLDTPGERMLVFQSATLTPDVMYGDCFRAESLMCWRERPNGDILLDIYCGLHFLKSTMLRRIIESKALGELARSFDVWAELAVQMLTDHLTGRSGGSPKAAQSRQKRRERRALRAKGPSQDNLHPEATGADSERASPIQAPLAGRAKVYGIMAVAVAAEWAILGAAAQQDAAAQETLLSVRSALDHQSAHITALRADTAHRRAQTAALLRKLPGASEKEDEEEVTSNLTSSVLEIDLRGRVVSLLNEVAPCGLRVPPAAPDPTVILLGLAEQQYGLTKVLGGLLAVLVLGIWGTCATGAAYAVYALRRMP